MSIEDINIDILDVLSEKTQIFTSKGDARRMIKSNAVSVNKEKIDQEFRLNKDNLLNGNYILVQKGKKNYFLITVQ